jgi:hypothetical protein
MLWHFRNVNTKINLTLEQIMKVQRGGVVSSTLSFTSMLDAVGNQSHQSHTLAALPPGKRPNIH